MNKVEADNLWTPRATVKRLVALQNGVLESERMARVAPYVNHGHMVDAGAYSQLPVELRRKIEPWLFAEEEYEMREKAVNVIYEDFMEGRGLPGRPTVYFYKHPTAGFNETISREGEEWKPEDIVRSLSMVDFKVTFLHKSDLIERLDIKRPFRDGYSLFVNATRGRRKGKYIIDLAMGENVPRNEESLVDHFKRGIHRSIIEEAHVTDPLDTLEVTSEDRELIEGLEAVLVK